MSKFKISEPAEVSKSSSCDLFPEDLKPSYISCMAQLETVTTMVQLYFAIGDVTHLYT